MVKVFLEYRGYGIKLLDMIQEDNMDLMVALKKFDPHMRYRFISYAIWIPAGAPHALENHTAEETEILVVAAYPIRG